MCQDESIINLANTYIVFSLPNLITQAFLHPLNIYLRTHNITLLLALCAIIAVFFHVSQFSISEVSQHGDPGVFSSCSVDKFQYGIVIVILPLFFRGV